MSGQVGNQNVGFLMTRLFFSLTRGTRLDGFSGQFFLMFEIVIFSFFVAIFDLVFNVETVFLLP